MGCRNERGKQVVTWAPPHHFHIMSRFASQNHVEDSRACRRARDAKLTQIDFTIGDLFFQPCRSWSDQASGIRVDHRCVHCIMSAELLQGPVWSKRRHTLKFWQRNLDNDGRPTEFHELRQWIVHENEMSFHQHHGHGRRKALKFEP